MEKVYPASGEAHYGRGAEGGTEAAVWSEQELLRGLGKIMRLTKMSPKTIIPTALLLLLAGVSLVPSLGYSTPMCYPAEDADMIFSHVERLDGGEVPQVETDRWRDMLSGRIGLQIFLIIHDDGEVVLNRNATGECAP